MFIPQVYAVALAFMILSMICWGSWPNTQKATGSWRFELFYWDYVWGVLLCFILVGLTLGRTDAASPDSFFRNLAAADATHLAYAFLGGIVYNISNILIVGAIAIAGMAVAFPVGIGMALVIGSVLNYLITPKGNPLLLFGGVALVCAAIVLDALAYRQLTPDAKASKKGIILSLLGGFGMGLFYPFVAKGISGENHLGPYTVACVFGLGILASNIPANYIVMRRPVAGPPVSLADYFGGRCPLALLGNPGRRILGRGDAFQLCGFLRRDGRSGHLLRAGARRDHGRSDLGRLRLERVRRGWQEHQAAAGDDVRFLYRGIGLRGTCAGGEIENEVEGPKLKVKSQIRRGNSMKSITALMAILLLTAGFCGAAGTPAKIPVILDTDIGTDIDDAFALALIINSPELNCWA